jgi:large subunit ribosomal protein L24
MQEKNKTKIKKNDLVYISTGKDKSKTGKVLKVIEGGKRVLVEKVNMVKKHTKPKQENPRGGISEKEAPLNISNVMIYCSKCSKPSRIGIKFDNTKKLRFCKKCNANI